MDVELFFDPRCPWTWRTSRWLVAAAAQRGLTPVWRTFDLDSLDPGRAVPPEEQPGEEGARAVQRLVEACRAQDRRDDAGRVYEAYGRLVHDQGRTPGTDAAREAVLSLGLDDLLAAIDDLDLDEAVWSSTAEAVSLVGDRAGSPVLAVTLDGRRRGVFGPVQTRAVVDERAGAVWDAVVALVGVPEVVELARDRDLGPQPDA
ncbi:MAG: DsbA family protein [Acidimicrobiia bacterium]